MFRWFETRIAAFPEGPPARPPATLWTFYRYFIAPVWPAFVLLLAAGFLGSVIEVALMAFVGRIVDLMKAADNPHAFIAGHWATLLFMAFVAVIARPLLSSLLFIFNNHIYSC